MTEIKSLPESVKLAASILFDLRAENVELMDLRGIKDVTDYFLVANCESEAQMQAILNELQKEFKTAKLTRLGVEYKSGVRWAIFDGGLDLMVHLFEETKRDEIDLNRLYSDGETIALNEADFVRESKKTVESDELI